MPPSGPAGDAARRLVVERDLVRNAFGYLTADAFTALPFEALGPTKALLKRFFSPAPWGPEDAAALAEVVGPGEGAWSRHLDPDLVLTYGWDNGRFRLGVFSTAAGGTGAAAEPRPAPSSDDPLAASFEGPVVPEATPNPRTIRFQVGPLPADRSRWYESAASVEGDPGVARLFAEFEDVTNVLVGPDFVAVSLRRPSLWERLLLPILAVVTEDFASSDASGEEAGLRVMGGPARTATGTATAGPSGRRASRLDQAWSELGSLRPADPRDLEVLEAAAQGDDPFRRQVAANLLREADPAVALVEWARLVADPARSVRRATVDAMVDVCRQELRPLLEGALADSDPWVRWKALRGLVELGPEPSRTTIAALADDADFRVRLEVAAALRAGG